MTDTLGRSADRVPAAVAVDQPGDPAARRGRPRNPSTDTVIIEATLELIAETGLTALSVESVAARAGVGKATIYRRWASKEALIEDALARLAEEMPLPVAAGTVRESLINLLELIRCKSPETLSGRIMPRMLSHAARSPELFRLYYQQVIAPRRARVAAVLRAGVESGELRRDVDIEVAVTLVTAPMLYLNLVQAGCGAPSAAVSEAAVDLLLRGLAAPGRGPAT